MKPVEPGVRLKTAAGLVRPGSRAADIGCDHGRLSVYLVESGRCPFVAAADLRAAPLEKARELVRRHGLEGQIDCRLGDGLSVLQPGEVQDIVIAGMGGETIAAVLSSAPWAADAAYNFVFIPATSITDLRRWLRENGFAVLREIPVLEGRYSYVVQQVKYTGEKAVSDPEWEWLGLLPGCRGEAAKACFDKLCRQLKKEIAGRRALGESPAEAERLLEIAEKESANADRGECP